MAGFMKSAMSYLGMTDVAEGDEDFNEEAESSETSFDSDHSVTPMASTPAATSAPREQTKANPFQGGRLVGRAIRDGVPVVLNLTGVAEAVAYRIVDFSAGVVFGVRGSIERVTPRVFLLSPAQVNIKVEEPQANNSSHDLFAD